MGRAFPKCQPAQGGWWCCVLHGFHFLRACSISYWERNIGIWYNWGLPENSVINPLPSTFALYFQRSGVRCKHVWDFYIFYYLFIYYFCVCLWRRSTCIPQLHVEVRGQLVGVDSLLPPCRFQGLNSGSRVWGQALWSTKPACWAFRFLLISFCLVCSSLFRLFSSLLCKKLPGF